MREMFQIFTMSDIVAAFLGLTFAYAQEMYERIHRPGRKPFFSTVAIRSIGWIIAGIVAERFLFQILELIPMLS